MQHHRDMHDQQWRRRTAPPTCMTSNGAGAIPLAPSLKRMQVSRSFRYEVNTLVTEPRLTTTPSLSMVVYRRVQKSLGGASVVGAYSYRGRRGGRGMGVGKREEGERGELEGWGTRRGEAAKVTMGGRVQQSMQRAEGMEMSNAQ